jgi:hypothetical protein
MAYPVISANKIQYDKDGTVVGYRGLDYGDWGNISAVWTAGIASFFDDATKVNLNNINRAQTWATGGSAGVWFFFPKRRIINYVALLQASGDNPNGIQIQGSNDTSNGVDGTWENAIFTFPGSNASILAWRSDVFAVSFTEAKKCIRIGWSKGWYTVTNCAVHLYGSDDADDGLIITNESGTKITSLIDLGNTMRGGVFNSTVYVKNASASSISSVTADIEGAEYKTSLDNITFDTAQKSLGTLAAGSVSAPIYVRFSPVAGTALGPSAGRILVNGALG